MYKQLKFGIRLLSLPTSFYLINEWNRQNGAQCCGILGVLTQKANAEQIVMEGIHLLENRGYDSAGIVSVKREQSENKLVVSKYASDQEGHKDCFERLESELELHQNAKCAIGHTRWATCGAKVDHNAHPHMDMNNRVALVHNGTLENFHKLKDELINKHHIEFRSETDTEVIVQYIGVYLRQGFDIKQAVKNTLQIIHGQWSLVIVDKESPNELIVCRQGSPILIGFNENSIFVASEKIAFEKHTNKYITVRDGEWLQLKLGDHMRLFQNEMQNRVQILPCSSPVQSRPRQPYTSFYEQEINEQPESCMRVLGNGRRLQNGRVVLGGLQQFENDISNIENIVMVACGSSNLAAQSVIHLIKLLRVFDSASIIEGSEFMYYDVPPTRPGIVVISQSGETKDLLKALYEAKIQGAFSIGVVNVVGSMIATTVDCGVYLNCGREVGVAASKSFTSQLIALVLVVLWISQVKEIKQEQQQQQQQQQQSERKKITDLQINLRQKIIQQLEILPTLIKQLISDCRQDVENVCKSILDHTSVLILGKGPCASIAKEAALKIKELTYKHAEGFSAGELKHGPLALIDSTKFKSKALILIILDDDNLNDMMLALSEVHSRNALTIVITNCAEKLKPVQVKTDYLIQIPALGKEMGWILSIIPFQLMALILCQLLKINPDKPRNLAKTVTVG